MRITYHPETKVPNLPTEDLVKIHSMCPTCRTEQDVFVAHTAREFWEHAEAEHPESISRTTA